MLQSYAKKSSNFLRSHRTELLWSAVIGMAVVILVPVFSVALPEFLFGGHIPGTDIVVPYWIMFTGCVGALLMMILFKIEDLFYTHEAVKQHTAKRRPTRRRYSRS